MSESQRVAVEQQDVKPKQPHLQILLYQHAALDIKWSIGYNSYRIVPSILIPLAVVCSLLHDVIGCFNCQPKEFMIRIVKRFFVLIQQKLLTRRIEREIYGKIFPQIENQIAWGYPFNSDSKLNVCLLHAELDARLQLQLIVHSAKHAPKVYDQALRYIIFRDLNARMAMYLEFLRQRIP